MRTLLVSLLLLTGCATVAESERTAAPRTPEECRRRCLKRYRKCVNQVETRASLYEAGTRGRRYRDFDREMRECDMRRSDCDLGC